VSSSNSIHTDRYIKKLRKDYLLHHFSMTKIFPERRISGVIYNDIPIDTNYKNNGNFKHLKFVISFIWASIYLKTLIIMYRPKLIIGGFIQKDSFITALMKFHPFISLPWGSDLLVHPNAKFGRIITIFALDKADHIFYNTNQMKDKIIELHPRFNNPALLTLFPWGVEVNEIKDIENKEMNYPVIITSTRHLNPLYNTETAIRALKILFDWQEANKSKLGIDKVFYAKFFGNGSEYEKINNLIQELGLSNQVELAGLVDNDVIMKYLERANIYVTTPLSDGASVSLLQAMASGLIPVASNVGGNTEWIEEGISGYLFETGDYLHMGNILTNIVKNIKEHKDFKYINRKIVSDRGDWTKIYNQLILPKIEELILQSS